MKKVSLFSISFFWVLLIFSFLFSCGATINDDRAHITFNLFGQQYSYYDQILDAPNHTVSQEINRRKINERLPIKVKAVESCLVAGADWRTAFEYSFPLLVKTVDKIVKDGNIAPQDSILSFEPESTPMFKISKEKNGSFVDEQRLYQDLYLALHRGNRAKIKVIAQEIEPSITLLDNIKLTHLRSKFTTDYSASNDNRKHNVRLSLAKINGTIIMPNQEFSFNKKVGRRTEKNGFKEAKIIKGGEYVLGFGGGVCQTSTTLYNAALRADLQIIAANNHSLPPAYVPLSFDAMVNSGSSDLKIKNNGQFPVFIRAYGNETTATVEIYGMQSEFRIVTQSVETFRGDVPSDIVLVDHERKYVGEDAAPGEMVRVSYGHAEVKSEGYLIYYDQNGQMVDKKLIRKDNYSKVAGLIAIAPN